DGNLTRRESRKPECSPRHVRFLDLATSRRRRRNRFSSRRLQMAKVRKAVITAAGRGTRQYPASTAVQKEMFPLVDRDGLTKPVIQIIAEEAIDSGIEQICIVTQPGEEPLYREYFKRLDDDAIQRFRGKDWAILESEKLGAFGERMHYDEQPSP